jgi:hypothetical protein
MQYMHFAITFQTFVIEHKKLFTPCQFVYTISEVSKVLTPASYATQTSSKYACSLPRRH